MQDNAPFGKVCASDAEPQESEVDWEKWKTGGWGKDLINVFLIKQNYNPFSNAHAFCGKSFLIIPWIIFSFRNWF